MDRRSFFSRLGIGAAVVASAGTAMPEVALSVASPEVKLPCARLQEFTPAGYFYPIVISMTSDPNVTGLEVDLTTDLPVLQLIVNGVVVPKDVRDILAWKQFGNRGKILVPNELLKNFHEVPTILALQPNRVTVNGY